MVPDTSSPSVNNFIHKMVSDTAEACYTKVNSALANADKSAYEGSSICRLALNDCCKIESSRIEKV